MLLCAALIILLPYIEPPRHEVVAGNLSEKPEDYFIVAGPDPVLLQAISNPGKSVYFRSWDEVEIDDLIDQYGTCNFEYQNNYYNAFFPMVEYRDGYGQLFWASFIGLIISTILLVPLVILKGLKRLNRRKQQPQVINP
jgi:hypothetical protein